MESEFLEVQKMRTVALCLAAVLVCTPSGAAEKAQPQPDSRGVYVVAQGVQRPDLQRTEDAPCPAGTENLKHVAALSVVVNPDGSAGEVTILNAQPSPLDQAAMDAVKKSTFKPGTLNGAAVPVQRDIWLAFRGDGKPGIYLDKLTEMPVPQVIPEAEFSDEGRRHHVNGEVLFQVLVTERGQVTRLRQLSHLPYDMDGQAIKAIRQYVFKPAMYHGEAVPLHIMIAVNFRLMDRR
jgi:TonB family protein